jgi:cytidine deaminase
MIETQKLFESIVALVEDHYPTGWGGAAGVLLEDGTILTSISPEFENIGVNVCMETGAYLEAARLKKSITHTLCLVRDDEHAPFKVLTPCGICQERLRFWGPDVLCAITTNRSPVEYVPLRELTPHHWLNAYTD